MASQAYKYAGVQGLLRNLHITLQQIKLFESVARHKSFTRAAEELFLTQPAVSIQIKRLEDNIERKLIETVGKKLFLTPAGEKVFQSCQAILTSLDGLKLDLNSLDSTMNGDLKIAIVSPAKYFMPYVLGKFLELYPDVVPIITVANRSQVLEALQANALDVAITGRIPDDIKVTMQGFFKSDLVVVAHPKHPLVTKRNITLEALSEHKLILREKGSGVRESMEELFRQHQAPFKPFMEFGSTEAIKQTVMAGIGISVLPEHTIRLELRYKHLKVLDVEGFPMPRSWYVTHLKDIELTAPAKAFIDLVQSTDIERLLNEPLY
jgi:DNA-binding transcriptional LysR family regulator